MSQDYFTVRLRDSSAVRTYLSQVDSTLRKDDDANLSRFGTWFFGGGVHLIVSDKEHLLAVIEFNILMPMLHVVVGVAMALGGAIFGSTTVLIIGLLLAVLPSLLYVRRVQSLIFCIGARKADVQSNPIVLSYSDVCEVLIGTR